MQHYRNHVRYYVPHHFVFYPIVLLMLVICIKKTSLQEADMYTWAMFGALTLLLGWLSYMMRQHYALNNQNRIVRLEMRVRYYQLTQQRFEPIEKQLNFKQVAALRFAGDEELVSLVEKSIREQLQPDAIKQLITNWQPDYMRV